MKKQTITGKEIDALVRILPKLRWPLPYPVFTALCKSIPLISVDLAVMPDSKRVLLTYRKDEFYDNWHIPGMILRHNEPVSDKLKNVAKKELGIRIKNVRFAGYTEYWDVRHYGIGLLFVAQPVGKSSDGEYFNLNKLPKKFLISQIPQIKLLRNFKKK